MKKLSLIFGIVATLICLVLSGCGKSNPLLDSYEELKNDPNVIVCCSLASDGSYILLDTNPKDIYDYYNDDYNEVLKALNKSLGLPEYLYKDMMYTRAADGKQNATFGDITVTWTYHPDHGIEAIYKYTK